MYQTSFHVTEPPFDNPLVRQAFASGVDREVIVALARDIGCRERILCDQAAASLPLFHTLAP